MLSIRDLAVSFRVDERTTLQALKGISFDIPANSTVALVGESGSGKSVTALAILGLLPRESSAVHADSRIFYKEKNLFEIPPAELRALRGAEISMVFQEPMSSLNPLFTVGFQLCEGLRQHLRRCRAPGRHRAEDLLREGGIPQPHARLDV